METDDRQINSDFYSYSKRHNKFLFPSSAKAIYGSFCRAENEIFNVVNYNNIRNSVFGLVIAYVYGFGKNRKQKFDMSFAVIYFGRSMAIRMDACLILEYVKVFAGYIFLMFIWPTVVFQKHLKAKTKRYHFSFCVTVQIVIVNTVVLVMGLLRILNSQLVFCLFYGIFLVSVWQMGKAAGISLMRWGNSEERRQRLRSFRTKVLIWSHKVGEEIRPRTREYLLLFIIVTFGMLYFSWSAFQVYSYGQADVYLHHRWVNAFLEGNVFSEGIYPEAMHCFIYCLHSLFGIRIFSVMKFLQCIHGMVFFLSAYCMLREIFSWRYSPFFVLALYLTLDFILTSVFARFQATLPMEFGLHTQFLCASYLIRYLKNDGRVSFKGKISKLCWDENLLVFTLSLAASIATHFYTTEMAFVMCASFALFEIKKIIRPQYLFPLMIAMVCGCTVAVTPMAGAFVSGIPFEESIRWGINVISINSGEAQEDASETAETVRRPLELTAEDLEVIEKLPKPGQQIVKGVIQAEYLMKAVYRRGYMGMYGNVRGKRIFWITVVVIGFCLISRRKGFTCVKEIANTYPPVILISLLSVLIFAAYDATDLGLPVLIPNHRFCTAGHMMTLAVMMMPADALFSVAARGHKNNVLQNLSVVSVAGIYAMTHLFGIFHQFPYFSLFRYDVSVLVTDSIIEEFPQDSYTVISPQEEFPQIELYGNHEEISEFVVNINRENYSLPTRYVFLYVEKKPLEYRQNHYFNGPSWLGEGEESIIKASEISEEAAQVEVTEYKKTKQGLYVEFRTIVESKVYEWCQRFSELYPSELNVWYEDDDFVCYYFIQDTEEPHNLGAVMK